MAKTPLQFQIHADFSDPEKPPCITCLRAAGQVQDVGHPFVTDSGDFFSPPFHMHCRCQIKPYIVGFSTATHRMAQRIIRNLPPSKLRPPPGLVTTAAATAAASAATAAAIAAAQKRQADSQPQ